LDFIWTEKLAVGVREIDIQHRVLFRKINDLLRAMEAEGTEDAGEIEQFFVFLEEYAASHFKVEEKAMAVYKYPDRPAHLKEHDIFTRAIGELKSGYSSGGATAELKAALRERLCDWLIDHVSKVDKALGSFLKPRAESL
jgi:hemerythrin